MKEGKAEERLFGYARVSAKDQNLARQLIALEGFGVKKSRIFTDKTSGKDFERPGYRRLLRTLRPGDVLVIKSIDRLGRCYEDILEEWRRITKVKKASIVVLDMPLLDTRSQSGDLTGMFLADTVLQLLSYVAQVERENIKQRQAEGIAAAQARGVRFGRPCIQKPDCWCAIRESYRQGKIVRKEAAQALGVSLATFDRWYRETPCENCSGVKK